MLDTTTETGKSKKLSRQWKDPFIIEEVIGPVNYSIRSTAPNSKPSIVHKNRLKMCYSAKIAREDSAKGNADRAPTAVTTEPTTIPKVKRARGRPKKASPTVEAPSEAAKPTTTKRKPGRPRKKPVNEVQAQPEAVETLNQPPQSTENAHADNELVEDTHVEELEPAKEARGNGAEPEPVQQAPNTQLATAKRKRGRPKNSEQATDSLEHIEALKLAEERRLRPRRQIKYTE